MLAFSEVPKCKQKLQSFWSPEVERCGIILSTGEVVERKNQALESSDRFEMLIEDFEGAEATWHSHPLGLGNLSIADYWFFSTWPNLLHFIVSSAGVRCYVFAEGSVRNLDEAEDYPSRLSA